MTARERLLRARRELLLALTMRALLGGAAAAFVALALARLHLLPAWTAMIFAVAVTVSMLMRAQRAWSLERVALWIEERDPSLRYAVVSVAEQGATPGAVDAQALATPWWVSARRAAARVLVAPAIAAVIAATLFVVMPARRGDAGAVHGIGTSSARSGADVDVLANVRATIASPAYSRRSSRDVDDPTSVEALVGSVITVTGDGEPSRVAAAVDSASRPIVARGDGWRVTLAMPARPALLRLRALGSARERLIVLAPLADAPPAVTLLLPARDSVMRSATGIWPLRAQLRDDIGLRDADFELVISSGQDESFTFRSTVIGRVRLADATERTIEARLSLDSLALKPGDVLQLRAVARDGNDVTGPGVGSSETRSLRVARVGEYDSVAVDPAPPGEPEGQVLSQRMLITLTEVLEKRRGSLARPTLLDESRRIAADQAKLRKRVGAIVFQRTGGEPLGEEDNTVAARGKLTPEELLARAEEVTRADAGAVMDVEGDETPILAVNKPLLEAFNAMWDAGRSLEQGEPARALPPMRRALAAIERARQAERIYLRGRPSTVVIDIAKVRLAGKDKGTASVREPRAPVTLVSKVRLERFGRATELLAHDPAAAADTLLVMRVEALADAPPLAAALDLAARALRSNDGDAIARAWLGVRRALGPAPIRGTAVPAWQGGR